jgi:ribonuclease BN (tRNA processing enzyme)
MKVRVLGCSGGIGGAHRTTALLVDNDILIDAGTGVGSLSVEELADIDHVFLTHAHLDHIACLPIMVDSVARRRATPLTIYATEGVTSILRSHIFNWSVWPDFTHIPRRDVPFMRYQEINVGVPIRLGERSITAIPAEHVVPAVGYHLDSGGASLVFSGDSTASLARVAYLAGVRNLRYLVVETAFSEKEKQIAIAAKHFYPSLLAEELATLSGDVEIFITHLKPGDEEAIMAEIRQQLPQREPQMLQNEQIFEF